MSEVVSDDENKTTVAGKSSAAAPAGNVAPAREDYLSDSLQDAGKSTYDTLLQSQSSTPTTGKSQSYKVEPQPSPSGPSSFSVSIEDDNGNLILVSKVEDMRSTVTKASDLKVIEESDRVVLTWHGRVGVKGFILHRTEKGKETYRPITILIPYFGRNDKDVFLYRFTDNSINPGVKYEYRLERVEADHKSDLTIGKLSE